LAPHGLKEKLATKSFLIIGLFYSIKKEISIRKSVISNYFNAIFAKIYQKMPGKRREPILYMDKHF